MKIFIKTKLLLASSLIALSLGGYASPHEDYTAAHIRAIKAARNRGYSRAQLAAAAVATGGGKTATDHGFERLREILGAVTSSTGTPATSVTTGTGAYLAPTKNATPTQLPATRSTAILASTNLMDLVKALNVHVTGNF